MARTLRFGSRQFLVETLRDRRSNPASEFLREARLHRSGLQMLRQEYSRLFPSENIHQLDDDQVLEKFRLAIERNQVRIHALEDSRPRMNTRALTEILRAAAQSSSQDNETENPRPSRKNQTDLDITFQVIDDVTHRPYPNIALAFHHPSVGSQQLKTNAEGIATVSQLEAHLGSATSPKEKPHQSEILQFIRIEERSAKVPPPPIIEDDEPLTETHIARVEKHRVRKGDSLQNLSEPRGLTWQELAHFNWKTDIPHEINDHLRDDVGCTQLPDGSNYAFDDSDQPGLIQIPSALTLEGLAPDTIHVIRVRRLSAKKHVHVLELEDVNFHTASGVFLPGHLEDEESLDAPEVTGLAALGAMLSFVERHPQKRLLVAGHTDSVGSQSANLTLSEDRASNVALFLKGEKAAWAIHGHQHHRVEDLQWILTWIANHVSIDCHPGPVDGDVGELTRTALKNLREGYNQLHGGSLPIEGEPTPKDWEAFYDFYDLELARLLDADATILSSLRAQLSFLEPASLGCGEHWPIEAIGLDGVESSSNRRVDLLLFDPGEEPNLSKGSLPGEALYEREKYSAEPIPVTPVREFSFQLWIRPTDEHVHHAFRHLPYRLEGPSPSKTFVREGKTDQNGDLLEAHLPAGHYELHIAGKDVPVAARWFDRSRPESLRAWPDVVRVPLNLDELSHLDSIPCQEPGIQVPEHVVPTRPPPPEPEPIVDAEPADLEDIEFDDDFTEEMLFASD